MRPTLSLLLLLVSLLVAAPLKASLEDIRHAQALLGPGTWSQLIRIENERPTATYPRKTFALVFEFNGILWFYTARDGTQSLSLFTGRVEKDRNNLHPLLLEIDSGFTRFKVIKDEDYVPAANRTLPNGCFLESMAAARVRAARGESLEQAGILLYYAATGNRIHGHAVLAYKTPGGVYVDDSAGPRSARIGENWATSPIELARSYEPDLKDRIVQARLVPVAGAVPASGYASWRASAVEPGQIDSSRSL
ncbi:MAG: hypothetical protein JNJ82_12620 [Opitutaceae bacterium]|jgi:hypothetical protein|nr:hypothetical protein [Opitutaceae bacterium]